MADSMVEQRWSRAASAVFRRPRGPLGALHNFAEGFPIRIDGVEIATSEALYQALRFPNHVDVQLDVAAEPSPFEAKRVAREQFDPDSALWWESVRVDAMRWVIRTKFAQYTSVLKPVLDSTDGLPIVEQSRRDAFWGAIPLNDHTLVGRNVLGRLWTEVRDGTGPHRASASFETVRLFGRTMPTTPGLGSTGPS